MISVTASIAELVASCIANFGYSVSIDDPYKGVELVRRYSDPLHGRNSLQIEINRGLYMDEVSITRTAGFARLKTDITRMVEEVCDYAHAHMEARQFSSGS